MGRQDTAAGIQRRKMPIERYREALNILKETGIFGVISDVLVVKPMDKTYTEEYKEIMADVIDDSELPVVFSIIVGHAQPRCIVPFGIKATVDVNKKVIRFED